TPARCAAPFSQALRPPSLVTITAHDAANIPRRHAGAAARGTGQPARSVIGGRLFLVVVFLLFAVSSGMLGRLGINHGGVTGAIASKIHPATYMAFFTVALLAIGYRTPVSFFANLVTRQPGTLAFLIATLMLAAYIVL